MNATLRLLTGLLSLLALSSCTGTRLLADPTLVVQSPGGGTELGVSTDYGVVFLGRHARAGNVDLVAWFGDGPSVESSVVEPLGGGLYTAETEIRLPGTRLAFETPRPGQSVTIVGRKKGRKWSSTAVVRSHPRVDGILLSVPSELRDAPDQVGAGVFLEAPPSTDQRLVALVSGRVTLIGEDGSRRTFLTAIGPEQLWRLVAFRRELVRKRRWVYREDIL